MSPNFHDLGTAPPAPRLIVGRGDALADLRKMLTNRPDVAESDVRLNGILLKELRSHRAESRATLAKHADVDARTLERAEASLPIHRSKAAAIADKLGTPLKQLILQRAQPTLSVVAVHGIGGVGKTTLARSLAHDAGIIQAFPDGVLWTSLGQSPVLSQVLVGWASALSIHDIAADAPETFIRERLTAVLRRRRVLLIIDDAWSAEEASSLMVGGTQCAVLVTTREDKIANGLAPTEEDLYRLGVLSSSSAVDLLEALAGSVIEDHHEEAEKLAIAVEQLPLALQVAGHLLREEKHSLDVASLLRDLQDPSKFLNEPPPVDVEMTGERTIFRLFKKSTDVLPRDARKCFAYLAPYAPKPARFNSIALAAQWKTIRVDPGKTIPVDPAKMAKLLVGRGLLEPVGQGLFWLHAMLKAHAAAILAGSRTKSSKTLRPSVRP